MKRTTKPKEVIKNITTNTPNKEEVKQYTREELEELLNIKQRRFCHLWVVDFNGTRSYMKAYGKKDTKKHVNVSGVRANALLRDVKIRQYIAHIQSDVARECGISKIKIIKRLEDVANANLTDLFKDWMTRKELNALKRQHPGLTRAIKKIESKIVNKTDFITKEPFTEEYVKIELHDSLRANEMILKALGMNEPEKIEMKSETKVEIDLTKYTDEEKASLLALSRKSQYIE